MSKHHQVLKSILDSCLLDYIKNLFEVVKKQHKYQIISGSNHLYLRLVLQWLNDTENHLQNLKTYTAFT